MAAPLRFATTEWELNGIHEMFGSYKCYVEDVSNADVIYKYDQLIANYKNNVEDGKVDEKAFTPDDIGFLENVVKVKMRIQHLRKEYEVVANNAMKTSRVVEQASAMLETYRVYKKEMETFLKQQRKELTGTKRDEDATRTTFYDPLEDDLVSVLHRQREALDKDERAKLELLEERRWLQSLISVRSNGKPAVAKCFICSESRVDSCFNPCGHTFCSGCAARNTTKKCYHCAKPVTSTIKLYIDETEAEE
jgi:hypothetical protein